MADLVVCCSRYGLRGFRRGAPRAIEGLFIVIPLSAGCSESLREPARAPPPTHGAESIVVDYPPPPAEVEEVLQDPGGSCVWIDGHWGWNARRWRWQAGGWVEAPGDCYYSWPMLVFLPGEAESPLYYWPPRWYPSPNAPPHECAAVLPCQHLASGTDGREATP